MNEVACWLDAARRRSLGSGSSVRRMTALSNESSVRGPADRGSGKASRSSSQVEQGGGGRACWIAWTTAPTQLYDGWGTESPDALSAGPLSPGSCFPVGNSFPGLFSPLSSCRVRLPYRCPSENFVLAFSPSRILLRSFGKRDSWSLANGRLPSKYGIEDSYPAIVESLLSSSSPLLFALLMVVLIRST